MCEILDVTMSTKCMNIICMSACYLISLGLTSTHDTPESAVHILFLLLFWPDSSFLVVGILLISTTSSSTQFSGTSSGTGIHRLALSAFLN